MKQFAIVLLLVGFLTACGTNSEPQNSTTDSTETTVDSTVTTIIVDTTVVDTNAVK
jgi:hypothetical protein